MWKTIVEPGRPKTTIWRTLLEYVMFIAFSLSQWLHERACVRYTYIACLEVCISFSVLYKRNVLPSNIIGTSLSQGII